MQGFRLGELDPKETKNEAQAEEKEPFIAEGCPVFRKELLKVEEIAAIISGTKSLENPDGNVCILFL